MLKYSKKNEIRYFSNELFILFCFTSLVLFFTPSKTVAEVGSGNINADFSDSVAPEVAPAKPTAAQLPAAAPKSVAAQPATAAKPVSADKALVAQILRTAPLPPTSEPVIHTTPYSFDEKSCGEETFRLSVLVQRAANAASGFIITYAALKYGTQKLIDSLKASEGKLEGQTNEAKATKVKLEEDLKRLREYSNRISGQIEQQKESIKQVIKGNPVSNINGLPQDEAEVQLKKHGKLIDDLNKGFNEAIKELEGDKPIVKSKIDKIEKLLVEKTKMLEQFEKGLLKRKGWAERIGAFRERMYSGGKEAVKDASKVAKVLSVVTFLDLMVYTKPVSAHTTCADTGCRYALSESFYPTLMTKDPEQVREMCTQALRDPLGREVLYNQLLRVRMSLLRDGIFEPDKKVETMPNGIPKSPKQIVVPPGHPSGKAFVDYPESGDGQGTGGAQ